MEIPVTVGIIATATILNNLITTPQKGSVESCVNAYYADQYNKDRYGNTTKTFLKCMEVAYPETFKEIRAKYEPPAEGRSGTPS